MKYDYAVKYNGKFYAACEEIPEPKPRKTKNQKAVTEDDGYRKDARKG